MTTKTEYPTFISDAWGREFLHLVDLVRQAIINCGASHGEMMAARYADDFGHDGAALIRCAKAEAQEAA